MSTGRSSTGSALILATVALGAISLSAQASCPPAEGADAVFVRAAHDLQLDSGQAVRLVGVAPGLALGFEGRFRLVILDARPDRWGRIAGLVMPREADADSLNIAIIRDGLSMAITPDLPADCIAPFLAAEAEARTARRGVWAIGGTLLPANDLEALRARQGQFTLVRGRVISVRQGRQRVFLNFGAFGSERFSVIVAVSRLPAFAAAGLDLVTLKGQDIEVRGVMGSGLSMELTAPHALVKLRRQ